jgi:hypothetical protein
MVANSSIQDKDLPRKIQKILEGGKGGGTPHQTFCSSQWNLVLQIGVLCSRAENNFNISEPTYPSQLCPNNAMSVTRPTNSVLLIRRERGEFRSTVSLNFNSRSRINARNYDLTQTSTN